MASYQARQRDPLLDQGTQAMLERRGRELMGLVLLLADWQVLADRLTEAGVEFVLPPQVRFEGEPGEQWTMFFRDPSGNPIEVKGFADLDRVYDH